MDVLDQEFEERLAEIETYLEFLDGVEMAASFGPPRLEKTHTVITAQQQRILYSGVFLQLYNLVEATVVKCLDRVTESALATETYSPADLTKELRREWVRVMARTHVDLNYENRLLSALSLCDYFLEALPIKGFKVQKGGGGNWDDNSIEEIAVRLGFEIHVSTNVSNGVKQPFRDELGALKVIRKLRNLLAHGNISFAECGENLTVVELRDLKDRTASYLREVVSAFVTYIDQHEFLVPTRRPGVVIE